MNAAPPVAALVGNLPGQDINFPVPAGLVQVSSANLDIGQFYYQAWTDIEGDYQSTDWHIVQLKEGPDPSKIYYERHRFFLPGGWSIEDDVGVDQIGIGFIHRKARIVAPGNEIPVGGDGSYYRYYVPGQLGGRRRRRRTHRRISRRHRQSRRNHRRL